MEIIDFHTHIGMDSDGGEFSFEALLNSMDNSGISKSVCFSFNGSDDDLIRNSINILNFSKTNDRIIPFLRFNPLTIKKNDLENLLKMGFKGIKFHPSAQKFKPDLESFDWIYELVLSYEFPILFHCNAIDTKFSHPEFIIKIAKRFPRLNIIMAHFFGNLLSVADDVLKLDNVYVDTSISSRTLRINQLAMKRGFRRFLFASDVPYDSQKVALFKLEESSLSDEVFEEIASLNAKRLLNL